jgi:hypothetical protein
MTWESPVFGDAYPLSIAVGGTTISQRIEQIHALLVARLAPILAEWMQPISPAGINEIIRQIAPKSTVFCSAVAVNEIDDVERLAQVGLSIVLVQWIDHRMDRGDLVMEQALRWHIAHRARGESASQYLPASPAIRTRLVGVEALEQSIRAFSRPEDADVLIENVLHEVLYRELRVREISRIYDPHQATSFWHVYAEEAAEHSIRNVALVYVSAAVYAIHRVYQPGLSPVRQVFTDPIVMQVMNGPASAMIRVLDDLGDRMADSGNTPEWGHFTLNIFNQPHPVWVDHFLRIAGMHDRKTVQSVKDAFYVSAEPMQEYVFEAFVEFVRAEFSALPAATYRDNQLFLEIGKRVVEAGYVNAMGDKALAEL